MRITCNQSVLAQGLAIANRAVSTRSTLPILSQMRIEACEHEQQLTIATTNLEMGITYRVEGKVEEAGRIALPAKLLTEFIASLPAGDVAMNVPENSFTAQVTGVRSRASLRGMDAAEFPGIPSSEGDTLATTFEVALLKEAIEHVAFAAARDDSRPVLTGVLVQSRGKQITFATADAFRLAVRTVDLPEESNEPVASEILIPAKTLSELARILTADDQQVEMIVTPERNQVLFHTARFDLVSRLLEGLFPAYGQLLPEHYETRAVIATKEFAAAIKSASLFARDSANILRVRINPAESPLGSSSLQIEAIAEDTGDAISTIEASIDGPAIQMMFNAQYMSETLAAIDTPEVALETTAPTKPAILKPIGEVHQIYLIMPMHVNR